MSYLSFTTNVKEIERMFIKAQMVYLKQKKHTSYMV